MNIKAVPNVSPYQVNNSTETTDHERQPKENRKENKKNLPHPPKEEHKTEQVTVSSSDLLPSQIIDSEKVIELLARRASNRSYIKSVFKKSSIKTTSDLPKSDSKKLNRVL